MLYFVRHSSTILNAGDPADPKNYFRGYLEVSLSDLGKVEALQTAEWFKGKHIDELLACPLTRTKEMMLIIAEVNDIPHWRLDPGLITWNTGVYAGHEATKPLVDSLMHLQRVERDTKPPQGEPYNHFLERWGAKLKELLERSKTKDIVAVSHHWCALAVPVILRGMRPEYDGPPDNGGVMQIYPDGFIRELFTPPAAKEAEKGKAAGKENLL